MRAFASVVTGSMATCLIASALASCGGDGADGTQPPPPSMQVDLEVCALHDAAGKTCPAGDVTPNAPLEVTVTVDPRGGTLERVIVEVSGLLAQTDTFIPIVPTSQPASGADTVFTPLAVGSLTFRARAEGGGRSGQSSPVTVSVSDTEPPVVTQASVSPAEGVEPGDTVRLTVSASDNAVVMSVVVHKMGALSGSDTIPVQNPAYVGVLSYEVPSTAPIGSAVSFETLAVDAAGLESPPVFSDTLTVSDYTAPITGGYVHTGIQEPMVPGDTLRGTIEAGDNHRLAWVGYRIGEPTVEQDSFPVSGKTTTYDFKAVAQSTWIGTPNVTLFARDSTGNVGSQDYPLTITVLDAIRRPYLSAPGQGSVTDLVFDAKRDRLYVLHTGTISVLPLSTLTHEPAILLPDGFWLSGGLEMSPDGDDLLLLVGFFPDTMTLGIVDMTQPVPVVDTVHLNYDSSLGLTHDLGVASNGNAFATLWNGTGGGGVLEYDLGTGEQTLRSDVGVGGVIPSPANLIVSGDRQRIMLRWAPVPCCPNDVGQVYDAGTDAFGTESALPFSNSRDISASADTGGDRYLIGGYLLDGGLGNLGYFDRPTSPGGQLVVSAISPDGAYGYFAQAVEGSGLGFIVKVRLADDVTMERMLMPYRMSRLMVLPDGETLIGVGATDSIYAVDLR